MWNTYYAKGLNSVVHLPDLCCVRVCLYDDTQKFLLENMLWRSHEGPLPEYKNVRRFGGHAEDGGWYEIELCYNGYVFRLEFASDGEAFVMELSPLEGLREDLYFYIEPLVLWGRQGAVAAEKNSLTLSGEGVGFKVTAEGEPAPGLKLCTESPGVALKAAKPARLLCGLTAENADALIKAKRGEHAGKPGRTGGWLKDASGAMWSALIWNTIYDPVKERVCVPVSRAWCTRNGKGFGSYVMFEWDTFFASLMGATISKQTAYQQIDAIMAEITESGMIPNFGSQRGGSPDRSQPPVGAYCLLKLYRQFGDTELLRRHFSQLLRWNGWWFKHRDGNKDGLLEWGSDPIPDGLKRGFFDEGGTMIAAMYESGLDNSPMFDGVPYNGGTHTMEQNDVGLNALYALDCQSLAAIAGILGCPEEEAALLAEYERVKTRMNADMYDEAAGMYCNTRWDGTKSHVFSPTNFYPLLAGIPDENQAGRIVREHLLNPKEFWGEYVIPSISRSSPAYKDQDYWRGRIWGPMNFLVYEGLRRAGFAETAAAFAEKSFALFMGEWEEESHIHENYNADTGDGDDKFNADPFYTWGALLAYLPVCQYAWVSPEGAASWGCPELPGASVRGFPMPDAAYTVDAREGFSLRRDGRLFLSGGEKLAVRGYRVDKGAASFEAVGRGSLTLHPQPDITRVAVSFKGAEIFAGELSGPVTLSLGGEVTAL